MNLNETDINIISSLIVKKEMTSYSISKDVGVSVPQIQYRIDKLLLTGILKSRVESGKTLYKVHPALKSKDAVKVIAGYIKEIVDIVDDIEILSPEGMKVFISFIISKTEISDDYKDSGNDSNAEMNTVKKFRDYLEAYAKENGIMILDIKGWTDGKIEWMALNERKCACRPDKRKCPCPEGLVEISKKGHCLCNVFGV